MLIKSRLAGTHPKIFQNVEIHWLEKTGIKFCYQNFFAMSANPDTVTGYPESL